MKVHKNARLTPKGRRQLVRDVAQRGMRLASAARSHQVSPATAAKWVRRWRERGESGLLDVSSRPHRLRAPTPERVIRRIIALRRTRMTMGRIAEHVKVSRATVSRVLAKAGISRLADLEPEPVRVRYERAHPGELLHLDTKKLSRILRPGHRVTHDPRDSVDGAGFEAMHIAIDDHSRVSYARMLPDEGKASTLAFFNDALAYYRSLGIPIRRVMTDNGPAYRSKTFSRLCRELGIRHVRTRPYTPKTNGKAERFIQSALREWAYGFLYRHSQEREAMLERWLHHYNWHRPHSALIHKPPITRLHLAPYNLLRSHN